MRRVSLAVIGTFLFCVGGCSGPADPANPLIGITSVYEVRDDGSAVTVVPFTYVQAIEANGGTPVILPTIARDQGIEQYVDMLDGLVLVGGDDIPPSAYGQTPHATTEVMSDQRYEFERRLIARWFDANKPLLGVCLGMQFVNVVRGGSLIQDIPSHVGPEVTHRAPGGTYHAVRIQPDSTLGRLLGTDDAQVLSNHHQAVAAVGRHLRAVAWSPDGVIEALERTDGVFGLFVQWHPESMTDRQHRDAIYGALIKACVPD